MIVKKGKGITNKQKVKDPIKKNTPDEAFDYINEIKNVIIDIKDNIHPINFKENDDAVSVNTIIDKHINGIKIIINKKCNDN